MVGIFLQNCYNVHGPVQLEDFGSVYFGVCKEIIPLHIENDEETVLKEENVGRVYDPRFSSVEGQAKPLPC